MNTNQAARLILDTRDWDRTDANQIQRQLGESIGGFEMLACILIVAATADLAMYQYRSWWKWSGEWKPLKLKGFRDLKLTTAEAAFLVVAVLLFLLAAYRETTMAKPT